VTGIMSRINARPLKRTSPTPKKGGMGVPPVWALTFLSNGILFPPLCPQSPGHSKIPPACGRIFSTQPARPRVPTGEFVCLWSRLPTRQRSAVATTARRACPPRFSFCSAPVALPGPHIRLPLGLCAIARVFSISAFQLFSFLPPLFLKIFYQS
jgi:hypothetical protein